MCKFPKEKQSTNMIHWPLNKLLPGNTYGSTVVIATGTDAGEPL